MTERLAAAGRQVFAPTLPGCGDRAAELSRDIGLATLSAEVIDLIERENLRDVVLVGHSAAGAVVPAVAGRLADRIRHLVFLDAHYLMPGERLLDLLPPEVAERRRSAARAYDGGLSLPFPPPESLGVFDPIEAEWLADRLAPHPMRAFDDPIAADAIVPDDMAVSYVRCTDPLFPTVELSAQRARSRAGWRYSELVTGHDAMITLPGPLTNLLLELG